MDTTIRCIDGEWYAFGIVGYDVRSIGKDCPKGGGQWYAPYTEAGIKYVSNPSPTRQAAYQKAKRHGDYLGGN